MRELHSLELGLEANVSSYLFGDDDDANRKCIICFATKLSIRVG